MHHLEKTRMTNKPIGILILIFLATTLSTYGQKKEQIYFSGYRLVQYKHPVLVTTDKYDAYFENLGEFRRQGKIILNDSSNSIVIKWIDGEDWIANIKKKEVIEEHDDWFGEVKRTKYLSKWTDIDSDCMLIITETKSSGCITTLKSRKVIDEEYGIDTWRKIFTFAAGGECIKN